MKKLISWTSALLLSLTVFTAGCSNSATTTPGNGNDAAKGTSGGAEQKYLTIATGGTSGALYALGGALSKIYNEKLGYNTSAQSTGASVENINLLEAKKVDMAFTASDVAAFAMEGTENFQKSGPIKDLKAISGFNYNTLHIIVLKDSGINTINDLKGKKIGVGAPNSATEIMSRRVLEAHGLTYKDVQADYLSFGEAAEQLKNNAIDAAVILSGLPNSAVIDLSTTKDIKILPFAEKDIENLKKKNPFFVTTEIPADMYKNKESILTVSSQNLLLVRADLPDEQAYKLTKAMYENLEELKSAHNAAKEIDVNKSGKDLIVPLHPGAEKFFDEAVKK